MISIPGLVDMKSYHAFWSVSDCERKVAFQIPPPDLPAKLSIELKRAKQGLGLLLNMLHSGCFFFLLLLLLLWLLQLTAYNSLVTIPLIIHILFSINTLEIGSGTVAQMGASKTIHRVTLRGS